MTDAEIKKALECCKKPVGSGACNDCPLDKNRPCTTMMMESALDLINRQQADNERLKKLLEEADVNYDKCAKRFYTEAIKEFAERLRIAYITTPMNYYDIDKTMMNLVKEMVGDAE